MQCDWHTFIINKLISPIYRINIFRIKQIAGTFRTSQRQLFFLLYLQMFAFRTKFYNLLNRVMPKEEISSLLKLKYNADLHSAPSKNNTQELKQKQPTHPYKPRARQQIEFLLKTKYNISLIPKVPQKAKHEEKQKHQQQKPQLKFEIKAPKGTRDYYPDQMAIRRKVIDTVVDVFKKHGGVQIDTPVFELKEVLTGKYGEDSKLIYDLDDQGGEKCSLRYDLTVPFARFMANNTNIQKIKRFHIGKVYRRDQPTITKGRFRQFYQCDFDIAGKYDAMIPDAEVLAIMQQILEALQVKEFLVKVNHRKILEAVISQAGCSHDLFKTICSSVDKLDKLPWNQVQAELITKGVTPQQCQVIGKLTAFKGDPLSLLKELKQTKAFAKQEKNLEETFVQMNKLFTYLAAMKKIAKVSFDLSLARGLDYYTGVIYEIVLTDKTTELGSISGGGRYDNLIGMFCQHQIPAVGGSLGIERLFTILEAKFKGKVKQNACEILVGTVGNVSVESKLQILSQLWAGNIKAETMYLQKAKPRKQIEHAFENQIPMILWLGEEELKTGIAKLKILYKQEEVPIKLDNIVHNISPYLNDFRKDYLEGKVILTDDAPKVKKA